jgi:FkbM family methyltransferase
MLQANQSLQVLATLLAFLPFRIFGWIITRIARKCKRTGIHRECHGTRYLLDARDRFQLEMFRGAYEPEMEKLMEELLHPGDVYVDVGAQIGYTAGHAASCVGGRGTILAIEPDSRAFSLLEHHFDLMAPETRPRVFLKNAGLSDHRGTLRLTIAPTLGHSRLSLQDGWWKGEDHAEVEVVTAADWFGETGIERIDFLKIDVEGHEFQVLRSLHPLMAAMAPTTIVIERNGDLISQTPYSSRHMVAFFLHHGYQGFCVEKSEPLDLDTIDDISLYNFLFVRNTAPTPVGYHPAGASPLEAGEVILLMDELINPTVPTLEARRLICDVRTGGSIPSGIEKARAFLSEHPEMLELRGHLAHWLHVEGRRAEAAEQYRIIVAANPGDERAARLLEETSM